MNGKQSKRLRRALKDQGMDTKHVRINGLQVEGRKLYQRAKMLPNAKRLRLIDKLENIS